ncbi:MAG: class I SAM-dependent methyltransferase [Anaerolineales bacterium]|nr:class I SAM-dependent methyltransferase [Anaerolineales bacterium]
MTPNSSDTPEIEVLHPLDWEDYELLDSGNGQKLERYGPYRFKRPAVQAIWKPALEEKAWQNVHAVFQPTGQESGGVWKFNQPLRENPWIMTYKPLTFQAYASRSRHMGVFPEQAVHWDWIQHILSTNKKPAHVLNLFGYTGLATLAAAHAGAHVTHVDASKKSVTQAHANQELSGLSDRPIRWIVDDATKFLRREIRRGNRYEGIILDPPKFGRGPKGEVWEFFDLFASLLRDCIDVLSDRPLFLVVTAYAIQASALSLYYTLDQALAHKGGTVSAGELAIREKSAGRLLSMAIYARWNE